MEMSKQKSGCINECLRDNLFLCGIIFHEAPQYSDSVQHIVERVRVAILSVTSHNIGGSSTGVSRIHVIRIVICHVFVIEARCLTKLCKNSSHLTHCHL